MTEQAPEIIAVTDQLPNNTDHETDGVIDPTDNYVEGKDVQS